MRSWLVKKIVATQFGSLILAMWPPNKFVILVSLQLNKVTSAFSFSLYFYYYFIPFLLYCHYITFIFFLLLLLFTHLCLVFPVFCANLASSRFYKTFFTIGSNVLVRYTQSLDTLGSRAKQNKKRLTLFLYQNLGKEGIISLKVGDRSY